MNNDCTQLSKKLLIIRQTYATLNWYKMTKYRHIVEITTKGRFHKLVCALRQTICNLRPTFEKLLVVRCKAWKIGVGHITVYEIDPKSLLQWFATIAPGTNLLQSNHLVLPKKSNLNVTRQVYNQFQEPVEQHPLGFSIAEENKLMLNVEYWMKNNLLSKLNIDLYFNKYQTLMQNPIGNPETLIVILRPTNPPYKQR